METTLVNVHTEKEHFREELQRLPHLADSPLQLALADALRELADEPAWQQSGRSSKTLVKYPDLRLVLVRMKAGTRMEQHQTKARFVMLALSGHLRVRLPGSEHELHAQQVLAVDRDVPHEVEALEESAFLLMLAWPRLGVMLSEL